VLEGITGRGKSTALEILGGEWYTSLPDAFGAKGFIENIQGVWLVEIPDLAGFSKRDHNHIVAFITTPSDRFRASYGRRSESHPRTCVFTATSENDEYLQSQTGIRRFWPLRCGGVDAFNLAGLREARDQLFAEAVHEFRAGATWHETPLADTQAEQAERREDDPWTEIVMMYASRHREVTAADCLTMALNIDIGKQGQLDKRRIASILRGSGWVPVGVKRNSAFLRVWKNPIRVASAFD
jgi:putative DNA primase/helicase